MGSAPTVFWLTVRARYAIHPASRQRWEEGLGACSAEGEAAELPIQAVCEADAACGAACLKGLELAFTELPPLLSPPFEGMIIHLTLYHTLRKNQDSCLHFCE